MITTTTEQNFIIGTEQKTGILYSEINQVTFLNADNSIVCYNEIGHKETITDEIIGTHDVFNKISVRKIVFSQEEMKTMIDGIGATFNLDGSNNLLDAMNNIADDLILEDITNNPQNYFGILVANWTKI